MKARLVHWLAQTGLADGEAAPRPPRDGTPHDGRNWYETLQRTRKLGQWNPLFVRIPLPNPEPLLQWTQYRFLSPDNGYLAFSFYR